MQLLNPVYTKYFILSFKNRYSTYEALKNLPLEELDILNKLYILQHYGCPSCLIDFTKDPLIALYFGITDIKGSSGSTLDNNQNTFKYPNDCYLSIYKIDCQGITENLSVKNITPSETEFFLDYDEYKIYTHRASSMSAHVGLIAKPSLSDNNYNLKTQNGCFVLYDNEYCKGKGLDEFLQEHCNCNNIVFEKPAISIYRIRYNSIFSNWRKEKTSLFNFLKSKNIYGGKLFNDLQGLKYDFNYFHQT